MGGPKIVVLQMKELIKSAIIAVVGLVLIILLIYFLIPKKSTGSEPGAQSAANYIPGTYAATIVLHNKPVDVMVTVTENEITDITMSEMPVSEELFYPLFKPTLANLRDEIVKSQSLELLIIPQEAEMTSKILIEAVNAALQQAMVMQAEGN